MAKSDKWNIDRFRDSGFNQRVLDMIRTINDGEIVDPDDVDTMERRYNAYLDYCVEHDMPISNLTAYRAIGITREQVNRWLNGMGFQNKRRKAFLERVKADCGAYRESAMLEGTMPVPTGIFWQKNYDGLRDVTETIVHVDDSWVENQSPEELAARYGDVIDAEFTEKAQKSIAEHAEGIQTINLPSVDEIPLEMAETASQETEEHLQTYAEGNESIKKRSAHE
jgi:hypothetical protein